MTMWKEHILARAIRIQNENWGDHAFFREIELKDTRKRKNPILLDFDKNSYVLEEKRAIEW